MALALAVYVTNSGLAGNTATSYGFAVSDHRTGRCHGQRGRRWRGVWRRRQRHPHRSLELLQRTNLRAKNGVLWDTTGDGSLSARRNIAAQPGATICSTRINNS